MNSYQVLMYAGIDPVTGKELRLTASADSEPEGQTHPEKFRAEVSMRQKVRTKATLRDAGFLPAYIAQVSR